MAKIFKGKIVILRAKTNSGIILLKDGSETQSIKFPSIFTDRDEVEVSFIDDNPDRDIESMTLNSKRKYYGFVRYYNKEYNDGEIVGTYPAAMSDIKFSLEDSPKLLNVISKNIKAWVARIEKIIKEFEKIIITNNNKRKNTEDRQKLKSLIKENSTVEKMISSLTEYLIKLKNQIDSEFYYEADRELIGILALLKKKNNDFKNIKNIPATKEILMKIIELNKLSQFSDITLGTNVTFKIIKTIDSEHIRAKDIGIIESKSEDNPKIKSPSYGRIIKKHDKHYWTNINKNMTIEVGQSFEAKVTASKEFGVFIETIFGHKGLIRNSELLLDKKTYSVKKPKLGEKIKVKLIYIKKDGKFDFSIKRLNYEPRGIDIKWILLTEESFKNFVSIDSTDIYYYYDEIINKYIIIL